MIRITGPGRKLPIRLCALFLSLIMVFFLQLVPVPYARSADLGLIAPEDLNSNISHWIILDARPKKMWEPSHLPGALSFSWEDYTQTDEKKIPYRVVLPEKLSKALGAMGINENTPIVVYGDADTSWGGEGWICWILTWIGHKGPVRLLSGGIQKWQAKGYALKGGLSTSDKIPVTYKINIRKDVTISAEEIHNLPPTVVLIDTRSTREWMFEAHIPGAIHIHWEDFYTGPHREPISKEAITELMKNHGIGPDHAVVYYCTGGVRSAYVWLVHSLWLTAPTLNFEGGMEEWKATQD